MRPPRLEACYFAPAPGLPAVAGRPLSRPPAPGLARAWPRLAAVLEFTARRHCPTWQVTVRPLEQPAASSARATFTANTYKLDHWRDLVAAAEDGDRLLLVDADVAILRPLDPVWDLPFDVAYTIKPPSAGKPFNAGVVFVRVSDRSRGFLDRWAEENRRLYADADALRPLRRVYGGLNQSALGSILTTGVPSRLGLHLRALPCAEWNLEDSGWPTFDPAVARVLHVKSALRLAVFGAGTSTATLAPLVRLWRGLEREATLAAATR
jgi:hypothetical protein